MPHTISILRARARLPATITSGREHESTFWVHVYSGDHTTTMARDDRERYSAVLGFGVALCRLEVVDAENVMRRTGRNVNWSNQNLQRKSLPHEMPSVRHTPHRIHIPTTLLEAKGSVWFTVAASKLVDAIFVDGAIPSACVDCIAVWAPASAGAPRWCASVWGNGSDGILHSLVPDSEHAINAGGEESGFGLWCQIARRDVRCRRWKCLG